MGEGGDGNNNLWGFVRVEGDGDVSVVCRNENTLCGLIGQSLLACLRLAA